MEGAISPTSLKSFFSPMKSEYFSTLISAFSPFADKGSAKITFVPSDSISLTIFCFAPSPIASMDTKAATPIMTPSMVNADLTLWALMFLILSLMVSLISTLSPGELRVLRL